MENILELDQVLKVYDKHTAVDRVSFSIPKGSIYGLLGPNGAGKTSLIRMITKIILPDEGNITLDGEKLNSNNVETIGYLPEERGLYKKMKVGEQLLYLAQLKGLSKKSAKEKLHLWLDRFEIADWWNKKIEELSKGMQQKVQFISTVVHEPKLLILDEPFSGLDPVNSNLIKEEILHLKTQGTSIIFSTHRMEQAEELCEYISLINNGKLILKGAIEEIRQRFKDNLYIIEYQTGTWSQEIANHNAWEIIEHNPGLVILRIGEHLMPNDIINWFIEHGISILSFREKLPTLNEVFISQVSIKD